MIYMTRWKLKEYNPKANIIIIAYLCKEQKNNRSITMMINDST